MSLNKEFGESMMAGVQKLVENSEYNKATNHVVFNTEGVEIPKDITEESMKAHVDFINTMAAQTEVAVAEIARTQYGQNDKLTTVDGTFEFGGVSINSQHHLKQQAGDEWLYGMSTTAVDYQHSAESTQWLSEQRDHNAELARKLFG